MLGAYYIGITKTKPNIHINISTKEYYENTIVIAEAQPLHWTRAVTAPGTSSPFSSPVSFYGPPGPPRMSLNRPGMNFWYDGPGCRAYWNAGGNNWSSCYRCHAFCPWSEPRTWYHDLAKWAAINTGSVGIDMLVSMAKGIYTTLN